MTLQAFFQAHPRIALGFSGGVDSSYLLYAATKYGAEVTGYMVQGAFQPAFERADAQRLAEEIGANIRMLSLDVLADPAITGNPPNRCYHCKKQVFARIAEAATQDGYTELMDGTNASDEAADRPGMQALAELQVLSPLRLCGLTKDDVRAASREAGLFTWNKPSYACLATRVPTGEPITAEKLTQIEGGEEALKQLGFRDFRIRLFAGAARIQVKPEQLDKVLQEREAIQQALRPWFETMVLDLETR